MISVCLAAHNGEEYIEEQLRSILVQLGPNDEVVVSDDGSTDRTLQIIDGLDDSRVRICKMTHTKKGMRGHYYVTRNFVNALQNAKGDIIFLADQDDLWRSNKVEICLNSLQNCDLVIHDFCDCDENLVPLKEDYYRWTFKWHNYLMLDGKYFGCAMAFRRNVLEYALPIPEVVNLHDFWIGILAEIIGKVEYVEQDLIDYRIRENSASHAASNSLTRKIDYRIRTMICVWFRVIKFRLLKR